MLYTILDSETDGLIEEVTKIHVLSYQILDDNNNVVKKGSLTNYQEMLKFLPEQEVLIGHNLIRYDLRVFKKVLGYEHKGKVWDTLGVSWYLYPTEVNANGKIVPRKKHGLEAWGIILGFPKPEVEDWKNLSLERYIQRCEGDVEINKRFWVNSRRYLQQIYNPLPISRILGYISFKLECAREQEEIYCTIARDRCYTYLDKILGLIEEKTSELASHMPENKKYRKGLKPKVLYKQDGTLSSHGERCRLYRSGRESGYH